MFFNLHRKNMEIGGCTPLVGSNLTCKSLQKGYSDVSNLGVDNNQENLPPDLGQKFSFFDLKPTPPAW